MTDGLLIHATAAAIDGEAAAKLRPAQRAFPTSLPPAI
jgi:hypothetical protein